MKIEIEIPNFIDKSLINNDLIKEMKISALIPLIELSQMSEAGVSRFLDVSRIDVACYFEKIGYTGWLNVDKELEDDPIYKKNKEENTKLVQDYLENIPINKRRI